MKKEIGVLWFRHDLRLHDNEALDFLIKNVEFILPVYVVDSRLINDKMPPAIQRMNRTRVLFMLESLTDLRRNLRDRGSDLIIRVGEPEQVLFEIAEAYKSAGVYCNRERMPHEVIMQDALEQRLWSIGLELHYFRGKMLFHTSDLPFPVARTPDKFSAFLKETEHFIKVRKPISSQDYSIPFPDLDIDSGEIPKLSDLGYPGEFSNPDFIGGESEAKSNLENGINRLIGGNGIHLRVSPWISIGNLSPKYIYYKLDKVRQLSDSLHRSLKRNLILRDYYRLTGKKEPITLFTEGGFKHKSDYTGQWDLSLLQDWIIGKTGHTYVDACMKCLAATGYLDHQQKMAVAHYLIDEMNVHWLLGAGYFESILLDYDPCSNYGNWQRVAGLSLDLQGAYRVNFDFIGDQMDPDRSFIHRWAENEVQISKLTFEN